MAECKMKITMSICAESSTDAVAKLRAEGMGFNAACKKVADEYNTTTKEGKRTTWQTIKKQCQREEKAAQSGDTVPSKTAQKQSLKKLKVPILTPKQQDTVVLLREVCAKLRQEKDICESSLKQAQQDNLEYRRLCSELQEENILLKKNGPPLENDITEFSSFAEEKEYRQRKATEDKIRIMTNLEKQLD